MCGIIGYVGERQSAKDVVIDVVIDGLKALEYRGYDSAGIALATDKKIKIFKTTGRVKGLEIKVPDINAGVGIGHTRWATHGKVCEENAHPHLSFDGKIAIVHNGVISSKFESGARRKRHTVFVVHRQRNHRASACPRRLRYGKGN